MTLDPGRRAGLARPLRIAQVAPPVERVPPSGYGGTERIVHELSRELARRGHEVTLIASGDSEAVGRHLPTVPLSLRAAGAGGDPGAWFVLTVETALRHAQEFDVIHAHVESYNLLLARAAEIPVVGTFHGRLDLEPIAHLLQQPPRGLVAISRNQAEQQPHVPWAGVVHNGLTLRDSPFGLERDDALVFVGRAVPEKGVLDAIEVARRSHRPLRMAVKQPWLPAERAYYDEVFLPATRRADVELTGELTAADRDAMLASGHALLMPGSWPEPFGLTAIEAMATGTPVICRPTGGLQEIVREGVDGFLRPDVPGMVDAVERVNGLDRAAIRERALVSFSAERMTDDYERVYASMLSVAGDAGRGRRLGERVAVEVSGARRPSGRGGAGTS